MDIRGGNLSGMSIIDKFRVPNAPIIGTATPTGETTATVSFTAPAYTGGLPITSYTAVSSPGGITITINQSESGTITLTGLAAETNYTFTVYATNNIGASEHSTESNSVTTDVEYAPTATGGTITTSGAYKIHTFTSSGTFSITSLGAATAFNVLVVAGGGGGGGGYQGSNGQGGGGAGGVVYRNDILPSVGDHAISIGTGGAGGLGTTVVGQNAENGTNTTALGLTALGGGRGSSHNTGQSTTSYSSVLNGGSGGGAANRFKNATVYFGGDALQPTSSSGGYGYPGGKNIGGDSATDVRVGGGGGGATQAGWDAEYVAGTWYAGDGGNGIINPIVGSTIGKLSSSSYYIAGGGGGGASTRSGTLSAVRGTGGKGGGGNGGLDLSGFNGMINTGGGGGGTVAYSSYNGGNGGSGVVIISYPYLPIGQAEFTTPGSYLWTAPTNIRTICVVCVGGGGSGSDNYVTRNGLSGGGGGLGWKNNISVVPGQTYVVVVGAGGPARVDNGDGGDSYFIDASTVKGGGGTGTGSGGNYVGDGGGNGGSSPRWGGGGGAGGYSGNGGAGSAGTNGGTPGAGSGGSGAGGYGVTSSERAGSGGGGVGIYGQGASGTVTVQNDNDYLNPGGGGGSGGANGANGPYRSNAGAGGAYGGGGASTSSYGQGANGAGGAVRIIWGSGRAFPSTRTADE